MDNETLSDQQSDTRRTPWWIPTDTAGGLQHVEREWQAWISAATRLRDEEVYLGSARQQVPSLESIALFSAAQIHAHNLKGGPDLEALGAVAYDLRHACVSTWLAAGVSPTQVARWAGHSVSILLRVYAHCVEGQETTALRQIEAALADGLRPLARK